MPKYRIKPLRAISARRTSAARTTEGNRSFPSFGTRIDICARPDSYNASGSSSRRRLARRESSWIGTTASRSPWKLTVRAPAWPNLIRARCSASRFSSGSGTGAETILELLAQLLHVGDLDGRRDAAVHLDLCLLVRDVVGRHICVDVDVQAHRVRRLRAVAVLRRAGLALGLGDRFVEHLHVQLEARAPRHARTARRRAGCPRRGSPGRASRS